MANVGLFPATMSAMTNTNKRLLPLVLAAGHIEVYPTRDMSCAR